MTFIRTHSMRKSEIRNHHHQIIIYRYVRATLDTRRRRLPLMLVGEMEQWDVGRIRLPAVKVREEAVSSNLTYEPGTVYPMCYVLRS
jgi:hypothetical protein